MQFIVNHRPQSSAIHGWHPQISNLRRPSQQALLISLSTIVRQV